MDEKSNKTKKRIYIVFSIAIFLIVFAFIFAIIAESLKENGYGDFWSPLVSLLVFFLSLLTAIILLFSQLKDAVDIDYKDTTEKMNQMDISISDGTNPYEISNKLLSMKFKKDESGYYNKKKFHFLKDSIHYYYKLVESTNISKTLAYELSIYNEIDIKCNNSCFILVIKKDSITKTDKESLKSISKRYMMFESLPFIKTAHTCFIVLCDYDNKYYYYTFKNKHGIKVYSYGHRLLLKLIKKDA